MHVGFIMRGQRLYSLPLRCGTKGSCPGQTFDPGSNIQISVNSFCFFYRFIACSDDVDGSKYKHAHFIQGWGYNARVVF